MKLQSIRHTGIVVRNLDQAVAFYQALGFKTWKRELEQGQFLETVVGLKNVRVETAKLNAPCGALLELLEYHSHPVQMEISPQSSNKLGCSHIALTVDSIDEALECVQNQGGSLVNPPSTAPNGKVRVAYCHDPEGNLMEFVEELL
jgi:catechol 2,3-dioxygenase-like lactoylglutathione lyase family enzyme